MFSSETDPEDFGVLARELRGHVLSMGGLALRNLELAMGSISARDASATAELYDIHESIEDLGMRSAGVAEQLLGRFPCDEGRLGLVLSSLMIGQLLSRISNRALEVSSRSRAIVEGAESEGTRLLDPLYSSVYGLVRQAMTSYADSDAANAAQLVRNGPVLTAAAREVATQLRERVGADQRLAFVNLNLLLISRVLLEIGTLAGGICEEILTRGGISDLEGAAGVDPVRGVQVSA